MFNALTCFRILWQCVNIYSTYCKADGEMKRVANKYTGKATALSTVHNNLSNPASNEHLHAQKLKCLCAANHFVIFISSAWCN